MKSVFLAFLFLMAAPASAQNFWIPAEKFNEHNNVTLEGTRIVDDAIGKTVYLLRDGEQVRIKIGIDGDLARYLEGRPDFQVCTLAANYDTGVTNTVLSKHPDPLKTVKRILRKDDYTLLCSERGSLIKDKVLTSGLKVVSPSQSLVKVRGVSIRGIMGVQDKTDALANYEYSRALGYLWGDGGMTTDGKSLYYPRNKFATSTHFGSVARSFFGSGLTTNTQGTRYLVKLDGTTPSRFLSKGIGLSDIPDKRAFLTSVVETEGAALVARIADDPNLDRCTFIASLVNDINPQCTARTCTNSSCATPNCAFIAHGKYRGKPYVPGSNRNCGVYLSGVDRDWKRLFGSNDFHFVKTDRTPGGEPKKNAPASRPAYTR